MRSWPTASWTASCHILSPFDPEGCTESFISSVTSALDFLGLLLMVWWTCPKSFVIIIPCILYPISLPFAIMLVKKKSITTFIGGINHPNHSQMDGLLLFVPTLVVIFHVFSRPKLAATWPTLVTWLVQISPKPGIY